MKKEKNNIATKMDRASYIAQKNSSLLIYGIYVHCKQFSSLIYEVKSIEL